MATRNTERVSDAGDVRTALAGALRARLATATTRRAVSGDWRGHFSSRAEVIERQLDALARGDALTIESWRLPRPWCDEWRPPKRVIVEPNGSITAALRA